ncbi:MAG: PKD domain-containing protein [Desulfobulbus sp.]
MRLATLMTAGRSVAALLAFWLVLGPCLPVQAETISVQWGYTPPSNSAVAGFRLYKDGNLACATNNPAARELQCDIDLPDSGAKFTVTALFDNGWESPPSTPFFFTNKKSVEIDTDSGPVVNAPAPPMPPPPSSESSVPVAFTPAPIAVISAGIHAGKAPFSTGFNASRSKVASGAVPVRYQWDFGDGSSGGEGERIAHTFRYPGEYLVTLTLTDSRGQQGVATIPVRAVSAVSNEIVETTPHLSVSPLSMLPDARLEVGEVQVLDSWVRVSFARTFNNPVVVVGAPGAHDQEPCVVQLRNITGRSVEMRLAEWSYQDGVHEAETVPYLVMEKGRVRLAGGGELEAGDFRGGSIARTIHFSKPFDMVPIVLTSVASLQDAPTVAGRVSRVNSHGFTYRLQQEAETRTDADLEGTIHYVAWYPGRHSIGEFAVESYMLPTATGSAWEDVPFNSVFKEAPIVLAGVQTRVNDKAATLRIRDVQSTAFQVKVEDAISQGLEDVQRAEGIGYLAFARKAPHSRQRVTLSWTFSEKPGAETAGFYILVNKNLVYVVRDPTARQASFNIPYIAEKSGAVFSIVAFDKKEGFSLPSNELWYLP